MDMKPTLCNQLNTLLEDLEVHEFLALISALMNPKVKLDKPFSFVVKQAPLNKYIADYYVKDTQHIAKLKAPYKNWGTGSSTISGDTVGELLGRLRKIIGSK